MFQLPNFLDLGDAVILLLLVVRLNSTTLGQYGLSSSPVPHVRQPGQGRTLLIITGTPLYTFVGANKPKFVPIAVNTPSCI